MRKMLITGAALLAGMSIAAAQSNPPGSHTQTQRQNESIGKPPNGNDNAMKSRAQGQLPRGTRNQTNPSAGPNGGGSAGGVGSGGAVGDVEPNHR